MAPDPKTVVPGDVAAIDETVTTMTRLAAAFEKSGQAFKRINASGWTGPTADAFREYFQQEPPKWLRAADAFEEGGSALRRYRDVLAWAQDQAEQACAEIERAERATEQAAARHDAAASPEPFRDPGADARDRAMSKLADATKQVDQAARQAAAALRSAAEKAPPEPGMLTVLGSSAWDSLENLGETVGNFWKGSVDGTLSLIQQLRDVTPFDPYNLTHPDEYVGRIGEKVSGLLSLGKSFVTDPAGTTSALANAGITSFTQDPAGFVGKLMPEAALGLATGGGSTTGGILRHLGGDLPDLGKVAGKIDPPKPEKPMTPWGDGDVPIQPSSRSLPEPPGPQPPSRPLPEPGPQPPRPDVPEPSHKPDDEPRPTYQRQAPHERFADDLDPWEDIEGDNRPTTREAPEPPAQHQDTPEAHRDEPSDPAPARAPEEPRHELADDDRQAYRERVEARAGGDFDDLVGKLRAEHPELSHLDDEKAMGLRRYVGEDANTLNHVLREGDAMDQDYMRPDVNVLRSALDEMPHVDTKDVPRAYRDIGLSERELAQVLERYRPGEAVEEPAFTSASKDIPPDHFREHGSDRPHKVRFIIDDPQHARDIEATNPKEREVLWQDHNRFLVQDLQEVGDMLYIVMRDLGQRS
ncbi:putative T7SS-secreted protein [Saccharopolyspora taberi]|uniref:Putative T7SS secretion signal domain-containing protein n=1 Tax=Saccharopolyspora taberi TaxID=60895 RepID=A0ABN3VM34_9PSEU